MRLFLKTAQKLLLMQNLVLQAVLDISHDVPVTLLNVAIVSIGFWLQFKVLLIRDQVWLNKIKKAETRFLF